MLGSQRSLFDMPREVCYLNAAAWSPIPIGAVEIGRTGAARKSRPWEIDPTFSDHECERTRAAAGRLINADASDIALVSSVGYGVSTAGKLIDVPAGSRVLVLDSDHSSPVLEWMARSGGSGFEVEVVKCGADHDWTAALLEAIERPGARPVALASIASVHWSDGAAVDLAKLRPALAAVGAGLLVDATHGAGVLTLDVKELDPDFVVFPTYKWLLGPYARAFLYVAKRHQKGVPLEQTSYGRKRVRAEDDTYFTDLDYIEGAGRFDMGERDFFISLGVATFSIELLQSWGADAVRERLAMLTGRIAEGLDSPNVTTLTERVRAPHVLSLGFKHGMPAGLVDELKAERIYASPRLGRLRLSPHVYNDEADCDRFVAVMNRIMA